MKKLCAGIMTVEPLQDKPKILEIQELTVC